MFFTKKQQYALDVMKKGYNTFLSGEAGTGKSLVIQEFTKYLKENNIKYVLAAPTGISALNIQGSTIHRTFGLSIDLLDTTVSMKNVEESQVIIIDEISMCRMDLFRKIARALLEFENQINKLDIEESAICRKKQIIVVGDFFQLPPVISNQDKNYIKALKQQDIQYRTNHYSEVIELETKVYAFQCQEWSKFNFKNIILDEVVRQSDKDYIDSLNLVRRGNIKGLKFIKEKSKKREIKNAIYLTSTNKEANRINYSNLSRIDSEEYIYTAELNGDVKPEDMATDFELKLKKGARVMSVVNMNDVSNGMLGTVLDLDKDSVTVKFDTGMQYKFTKYKWGIKGFKKQKIKAEDGKEIEKIVPSEVGTFTQIPLKHSWAITIHKSQGQTYEKVNLSPDCFCEGQLYVGLSRAKDINKLHLTSEIKDSYLKVSPVVKRFYDEIEKNQIEVKEEILGDIEQTTQKIIEEMGVEEDYTLIKVPKNLEKAVLKFLKENGNNKVDNYVISVLYD